MFKRWKLLLTLAAGLFAVVFGAAMFDPFFRQLTFGPKFNGIPLVAWQKFFREWDVMDPQKKWPEPTKLEIVQNAVVPPPSVPHWKRLSGEDRRAILLTLGDDPQEIVQLHVAGHLGDVPANDEVVTLLKRYVSTKPGRVRHYAVRSLGNIEPPAVDAIPELLTILAIGDFAAQDAAISALGRIGSKAPDKVVPDSIALVRSPNASARLAGLAILSGIRPGAGPAIPILVETLRDSDPRIRVATLRTLGIIRAKEALPQIILATHDSDSEVRDRANDAIFFLGPDAKTAVPRLVEQVKTIAFSRDHPIAPTALRALGGIGADAQEAIPELLKLRDHPSETVRRGVEEALSKIDARRFPPKAAP